MRPTSKNCGFVWGEHDEHYCGDNEGECLLFPLLWLHSCSCGDDVYEDKRITVDGAGEQTT